VFVDFIHKEAKACIDPSFNLFTQAPTGRNYYWERPMKTPVYVHKSQGSSVDKPE
jgi:hypothetical protein